MAKTSKMNTYEHDALVGEYEHQKGLPREAEALHMLKKIASLVKPIMRKRNWRVGKLVEFYPEQKNLLGLNINRGQQICLRLRYAGDVRQFMPLEHVTDTMLHELSHIIHGPHDQKFQALWDELRGEQEALVMKGYSGEGFLTQGHKLGGRGIPVTEMRRQARAAAEKRRVLQGGSGQRVGGATPRPGSDMRAVIANAAIRRTSIIQGCASGTKEAGALADQASRNGFRTKAEEDDANERAMSQALWELVQEDESRKAGVIDNIWSTDGLTWNPDGGLESTESLSINGFGPATNRSTNGMGSSRSSHSDLKRRSESPLPQDRGSFPIRSQEGPVDRNPYRARSAPVVKASEQPKRQDLPSSGSTSRSSENKGNPPKASLGPPRAASVPAEWTCAVCTLHNPQDYLCCDACGVERSAVQSGPENYQSPPPVFQRPLGWNCNGCGTFMETQWWTCSRCGLMKASS